jgi:hypothetical protein
MEKVYLIECRTGCSCCSSENHYRGPFRTKEDAERRIAYFKSPDSAFWPLASQYSRRGNYRVEEHDMEKTQSGRVVIGDHVIDDLKFIEVLPDGTVLDNDAETLGSTLYW